MATIPLDLIPPFLAVAELGSFSTAAKRLGVEKSSVSRAVARLEQGVGDRLFLRTTRRVSLTDAGRSVRDRLREPHANLDAALRAVLDTASQPRGRIVVTTAVDFGVRHSGRGARPLRAAPPARRGRRPGQRAVPRSRERRHRRSYPYRGTATRRLDAHSPQAWRAARRHLRRAVLPGDPWGAALTRRGGVTPVGRLSGVSRAAVSRGWGALLVSDPRGVSRPTR